MTLQAVCFDLDDTLYDYRQYAYEGLKAAATTLESQTGRDRQKELLALYFVEDTEIGTFDALIERHDLDPGLVEDLIEAFHDATTPMRPYPATEPVLEHLEEEYLLGLITDGREGQTKLDRLDLDSYFDATLVTPTIDSSKHDPGVFERIFTELDIRPEQAVYVGDDPRVDFRVANELGMGTIRLRRGRYRDLDPERENAAADHQILTLSELPEALDQYETASRSQRLTSRDSNR